MKQLSYPTIIGLGTSWLAENQRRALKTTLSSPDYADFKNDYIDFSLFLLDF